MGFSGRIVADETLREGQYVAGANRDGWHLRGVQAGRDFQAEFADADLIGIPTRITAGKKSLEDGAVDVRDRATGEERRVNVADLGKEVG